MTGVLSLEDLLLKYYSKACRCRFWYGVASQVLSRRGAEIIIGRVLHLLLWRGRAWKGTVRHVVARHGNYFKTGSGPASSGVAGLVKAW